ncbi:hypothetical protein HY212_06840 [Candidatus Pacearchaeota archaeon]|nr:hypothetical protein [Candidatus Pacearchaeota archaeon]
MYPSFILASDEGKNKTEKTKNAVKNIQQNIQIIKKETNKNENRKKRYDEK